MINPPSGQGTTPPVGLTTPPIGLIGGTTPPTPIVGGYTPPFSFIANPIRGRGRLVVTAQAALIRRIGAGPR